MTNTQHLTPEQIHAWIDGELVGDEASFAREHLATCTPCTAEMESLRDTKAIFGMLRDVELPRSFVLPASMAKPAATLQSVPTPAVAERASVRRYEPLMRLMSIAAVLAFLVLGGINFSGVLESDDSADLPAPMQQSETNSTGGASENQETNGLRRGEVTEQGDAAVDDGGTLNIFNANVDTPAQTDSTGLTALDITTAAVGIVALTLIAGWILIHFRAGPAS